MDKQFKEVFVVEGHHDEAKLKHLYPSCDVVITNGKEISEPTLTMLNELNKTRGLILLLDPDFPGESIRKKINNHVGETKHVFLAKHKCIDQHKNKVGVEHADDRYLKMMIDKHIYTHNPLNNPLKTADLISLKLMGNPQAKRNRKIVSEYFHLGECNAKTMRSRLNMFGINKSEIQKVIT